MRKRYSSSESSSAGKKLFRFRLRIFALKLIMLAPGRPVTQGLFILDGCAMRVFCTHAYNMRSDKMRIKVYSLD